MALSSSVSIGAVGLANAVTASRAPSQPTSRHHRHGATPSGDASHPSTRRHYRPLPTERSMHVLMKGDSKNPRQFLDRSIQKVLLLDVQAEALLRTRTSRPSTNTALSDSAVGMSGNTARRHHQHREQQAQ